MATKRISPAMFSALGEIAKIWPMPGVWLRHRISKATLRALRDRGLLIYGPSQIRLTIQAITILRNHMTSASCIGTCNMEITILRLFRRLRMDQATMSRDESLKNLAEEAGAVWPDLKYRLRPLLREMLKGTS